MLEFDNIKNKKNANNQPIPKLKIGNLIRRVHNGLEEKERKTFLRELDGMLNKYYIKANMQPPLISITEKGHIINNRLKKMGLL